MSLSFPRVFGQHPETITEPSVVLGLLAAKSGGWANSPLDAQFADPVRGWIDIAHSADRRRFFTALQDAPSAIGFLTALDAAEQLVTEGDDPLGPKLGILVRRIAQGTEFETRPVDLGVHDQLISSPQGALQLQWKRCRRYEHERF